MRVTLGRRGEYAVRAVLDLTLHRDTGRRKSREIADAMEIPSHYLPHIMAPLVRCGLVSSAAGRDGGYRLEELPSEVSLLEVIERAEGPLEPDHCALRGGRCDPQAPCPLHHAWMGANQVFANHLREITFDRLIAVNTAFGRGTKSNPAKGSAKP